MKSYFPQQVAQKLAELIVARGTTYPERIEKIIRSSIDIEPLKWKSVEGAAAYHASDILYFVCAQSEEHNYSWIAKIYSGSDVVSSGVYDSILLAMRHCDDYRRELYLSKLIFNV